MNLDGNSSHADLWVFLSKIQRGATEPKKLKPKGRLHLLGVVLEPLNLSVSSLLSRQKSVSASPVGSPNAIAQMLEFCQRHNIKPITQHFPLKEVNEAMEHLRAGKARYRIVLDMN